jgi:two-component system OmpR family sensor kinase
MTGPEAGRPATDTPDRSWWRRSVPVRLRITVASVLLAALALIGAGFAVFTLQADRLDDDVNASISGDLQRFDALRRAGLDGSAEQLLTSALRRSAPDPSEAVVVFLDGRPSKALAGYHDDVQSDPRFVDAVNALADTGGVADIDSKEGPLRIAVKPVRDADTDGAIVYAYVLDEVRSELTDIMRTYMLVALAALVVVAVGAYAVSGRLLSPIRELRRTTREISDTDLTRRITATGNDDLTDLTVTFNDMLDRLDGAFTTQRQFLDDVGHELKTPITIVRGHLELMDAAEPGEVTATRGLVLDEVDRMARLVEELIVLAKSRRPDFLHVEPVDLGRLTDTIHEKVRGLGGRDWLVDERAAGALMADPQRLTQAVLQLAVNAVRHTQPGAVVAVGSRIERGVASVWVRDEGDGVPLDQQQGIFDRFRRGEDDLDGSGLGLAIVRAIAEAHSGTVELASVPGRGATFTLRLPLSAGGPAESAERG